jgi:hypothetical protein
VNLILEAAIARAIATLPEPPEAPTGSLGYGRDLWCVSDCADDFRTIGPDDPLVIMQAIARRFQTPRGIIATDREYGLDLRGYLHKPLTQRELRQLQTQALNEANKETRIDPSATQLSLYHSLGLIRCEVLIRPLAPRADVFPFVVHVSRAGATVQV